MKLNGRKIDESTLEIDGVDTRDYPDFVDAYLVYAQFSDGTPLTEAELEALNDQEAGALHQLAYESLL